MEEFLGKCSLYSWIPRSVMSGRRVEVLNRCHESVTRRLGRRQSDIARINRFVFTFIQNKKFIILTNDLQIKQFTFFGWIFGRVFYL